MGLNKETFEAMKKLTSAIKKYIDEKYKNKDISFASNGNLLVTIDGVTKEFAPVVHTDEVYSIKYKLSNATCSNKIAIIGKGESYITTISAVDGYRLSTLTVTMGGVDITSSVYNDGTINIPNVTGIIFITVTTVSITDTNSSSINTATINNATVVSE